MSINFYIKRLYRKVYNVCINSFLQFKYTYICPPVRIKSIGKIFKDENVLNSTGTLPFSFSQFDQKKITKIYNDELNTEFEKLSCETDNLLKNVISFFDLKNLPLGSHINWHMDYSTKNIRPQKYYKNINLDAQVHLGDIKYVWELNRLQFLFDLGKLYFLTKDEKYALKSKLLIIDWIKDNPFKIGVNWLTGLEVGLRAISLIWSFHFNRDSTIWDAQFKKVVIHQLVLHAIFIFDHFSIRKNSNNHLIGEASALYVIASFLEDWPQSSKWKLKSKSILEKEIFSQVYSDGGDKEQAFEYHRFVADFFTYSLIVAEKTNDSFSPDFKNRLRQMYLFILKLLPPNRVVPEIGDDDGAYVLKLGNNSGRKFDYPVVLANILFKNDFKYKIENNFFEEIIWLKGVELWEKLKSQPDLVPEYTSIVLNHSGYGVSRASWDKNSHYLLFDFGEQGMGTSGHGHADALHFTFQVGNIPVFIDSGTFAYGRDLSFRDYFINSYAHNVCIIDDEPPAKRINLSEPFGWKKKITAKLNDHFLGNYFDFFDAEHDGYKQNGVLVQRNIFIVKSELILVIDNIRSEKNHKICRLFHVHPEIQISSKNEGIISLYNNNSTLVNCYYSTHEVAYIDSGTIDPIRGWYSAEYGTKLPGKVINLSTNVSGDTCLPFLILNNSGLVKNHITNFESYVNEDIYYVHFYNNETEYLFLRKYNDEKVEVKNILTDAHVLFVEHRSQSIKKIFAKHTSIIKMDQKKLFKSKKRFENHEYIGDKSN